MAQTEKQAKVNDVTKRNQSFVYLLFFLACLTYANTFLNGYNLDDYLVTENNPLIEKGFAAIPEIFSTHYVEEGPVKVDYRPLVKTSYAIEYALFGYNPCVSHIINTLLFAFCCVLLFRALEPLFDKDNLYLLYVACVLFVLTPANTEVVNSLKNRDELMAFICCMATAIFFLKYESGPLKKYIVFALVFFILALLSKISAAPYIFSIPLILFIKNANFKKSLFYFLSLAALLAFYLLATKLLLGNLARTGYYLETPLEEVKSMSIHLGTAMNSLLFYFSKLLFPYRFSYYYGYNQIALISFFQWLSLLSFAIHTALLVWAIWLYRQGKKLFFFAILYYFIQIFLFSNIVLPYYGIVGDRSMFAAGVGFLLMLVFALDVLFKKYVQQYITQKKYHIPQTLFYVIALISVLYFVRTVSRNTDWEDKLSLYRADITHLQNSAKANFIIAKALRDEAKMKGADYSPAEIQEMLNQSFDYFKQATEVYPAYAEAWEGMGMIETIDRYRIDEGNQYFVKAFSADSTQWKSAYNIAKYYKEKDMDAAASNYYKKVLNINPSHDKSLIALINYYFKKKDYVQCTIYTDKALELMPEMPQPYDTKAYLYLSEKDTVNAIQFFKQARARNLKNVEAEQLIEYYESRHEK